MWIFGLVASSDGKWLLSTDSRGRVTCWDLDFATLGLKMVTGDVRDAHEPQRSPRSRSPRASMVAERHGVVEAEGFQAHGSSIYCVLDCKEKGLVFTGSDEEIRYWREPWGTDVKRFDRKPVGELRIPQSQGSRGALSGAFETNAMALLSDKLIAASGDSTAWVFDIQTEKMLHGLSGHEDYLQAVVALERNQLIATGSEDGTCKLWDLRAKSLDPVASFDVGDSCSALLLSEKDGNWLVMGGSKGGAGVVSMAHLSSRVVTRTQKTPTIGRVQALSYNDTNLVVAGDSPTIEYWSKNLAEHVVNIPTSSSSIFALSYNEHSGVLASAGSSPYIDLFSDDRNQIMSLLL